MRTYKAFLRGDCLEWRGEAPESRTDAPLSVQVIILDQEPLSEEHACGSAMAALLEKLAERNTFSTITDPVSWQRELRQDRVLPGRDG